MTNEKLNKLIGDCSTQETISKPLTEADLEQYQKDRDQGLLRLQEEQEKEAIRNTTVEELKVLSSSNDVARLVIQLLTDGLCNTCSEISKAQKE